MSYRRDRRTVAILGGDRPAEPEPAPPVSVSGDNVGPLVVVNGTCHAPIVVVTGGAPTIRFNQDS